MEQFWFILSLATLFFWSGSDLFSKIGCQEIDDRHGALKMGVAVGLVMGLHALYSIFVQGVEFNLEVIWRYLPISFMYILSMTIGYVGLKYIELSISSPICNTSGAIVVLIYLLKGVRPSTGAALGLAACTFGIIGLGIVEYYEDEELRAERQKAANRRYSKSIIAIAIPLIYCVIDALGTYGDSVVLQSLDEESANTAYELTFAIYAIVILIYLIARGEFNFDKKLDGFKLAAAVSETAGQFCYVFALAANPVASAPIISAYCMLSVIWSRIFLKEKLSLKHYATIALTVAGIILLGIYGED